MKIFGRTTERTQIELSGVRLASALLWLKAGGWFIQIRDGVEIEISEDQYDRLAEELKHLTREAGTKKKAAQP
jgi:hypothetical protein